ncbi:MAG: hypothetical protein IT453_03820 [Planctomycetes bacterium]|nr:hypothetical protein [Planctomycetota bacterium]
MAVLLSSDLDDPNAYPYFLWDDPMTNSELRERLATASPPEHTRLLGKILREARDTEVWRYITPEEFARRWDELAPHLGRRRPFWEWLFTSWVSQGLLQVARMPTAWSRGLEQAWRHDTERETRCTMGLE